MCIKETAIQRICGKKCPICLESKHGFQMITFHVYHFSNVCNLQIKYSSCIPNICFTYNKQNLDSVHTCLYTMRIHMNIVFNLNAESRQSTYIFCSICVYKSPPAHLLQVLWTPLAIGYSQLTGRAGVISEQHEEWSKSPVAAVQTEEQVVELDTNTSRAIIALVTQSEENIWLAAVSAPTQQHSVTLCTLNGVCFFLYILYWTCLFFLPLQMFLI